MKHTQVPASQFGVALASWIIACASVAVQGSPINSKLFARLAAVVLAILGGIALNQTRLLREERDKTRKLEARRSELGLTLMSLRNKYMHTKESIRIGRAMKPRPDDVFVVTYPKCGTTWMTQICHQLRTGGSDDFGEITEVCPWDILAHDCGQVRPRLRGSALVPPVLHDWFSDWSMCALVWFHCSLVLHARPMLVAHSVPGVPGPQCRPRGVASRLQISRILGWRAERRQVHLRRA